MADWEAVTVIKKRPANSSAARSQSAVNAALRSGGEVTTEKKSKAQVPPPQIMWYLTLLSVHLGTGNKHSTVEHQRIAKLDRETEELSHQKVSMSVGRAIQQGRQEKGLTQKDVAVVSTRARSCQEFILTCLILRKSMKSQVLSTITKLVEL
jgi:ribosome-binding protein aMBF1 (putative translation factor)